MSNEAARLCEEGLELMTRHMWEEAEEKMSQATTEDPKSAELWYNLGKCCFHQDKFEEAVRCLDTATGLNPEYVEAWALLGSCYYAWGEEGGVSLAIACFEKAEEEATSEDLSRECATARAHCMLAQGDFQAGWEEYQYRLAEPDTWDGTESLRGKTLLIKAEGGLGDQIFWTRYAYMLGAPYAGHVLWEVDEPLVGYLEKEDIFSVVRGEEMPEHDLMIHAGSLPYIFGTKTGTIPAFNDAQYSIAFGGFKNIGLAWSGNPLHPDDHHRSIPLAAFEPLFALGKNFYTMQKDVRYADRGAFKKFKLKRPNFKTIKGMANAFRLYDLDLIITVDTMTAHLAGAEGIPTLLLLPYACDWRWGLEGDRTPWYPSVRIFRQGEDREWGPVIQRVVEELSNG